MSHQIISTDGLALRALVGKKIVAVEVNRFETGRATPRCTTDPKFILDDGSYLYFFVQETEVGDYGVEIVRYQ